MTTPKYERPSLDEINAALNYIPAIERELWIKIGMALHDGLGSDGFAMFDTWSQTASNYNAQAVKSTWKGFKAGGKVGIASLFFEAAERGFVRDSKANPAPISHAENERLIQERKEREQAEQLERERQQASAATRAVNLWSSAKAQGESPYLQTKKVQTYGLRFAIEKESHTLLIPMHDDSGKLWNVQRIFADGNKRFLKGGKTSECFHVIGDIATSNDVLIAEGYATGATLHEAVGCAVVLAFSAHNFKHVVKSIRTRYPEKRVIVCADNDIETEKRIGKNTGVIAATEAANLHQAAVCVPEDLPHGGDFNDLMQAMGMDEVRKQIATAMQTPSVPILPISSNASHVENMVVDAGIVATENDQQSKQGKQKTKASKKDKSHFEGGETPTAKPFYLNHDDGTGVFYHGFYEGEPLPAFKICSSLKIIAQTRDAANSEWGYLLEFSDPDKHTKRWLLPTRMLSGDGTHYRAELLSMGLSIEPSTKAKNHLTNYLQTTHVTDRVRCVDRIGWHHNVYVLPDKTIGHSDEVVMFQPSTITVSHFKQRGTLDEWREHVAAHCQGNTRLQLVVAAGFASLLLHHAKMQSFGLHIMGSSSTGKSTAMKVAASLFGGTDYAQSWHITGNSLEATAQKYSDALLVLDELGQADPKTVGDIVYMLSNEKGKGRATQNASAKKISTWRAVFISDGEISLETKAAEAGKTIKGGQAVRMAHIHADAGKGLGLFDTVHGFAEGGALSNHLVNMVQQYHGTAGQAFIEWLVDNIEHLPQTLEQAIHTATKTLCPDNAHGQVKRVAGFFALIAAGGELATGAGITGWQDGDVTEAVTVCFNDWLNSRGSAGDIEQDRMLSLLPDFISKHGDSRFAWVHRAMDDHAPKTINQAGYKRMLTKDGVPIKSNSEFGKQFGDTMHQDDAKESSIEYFLIPQVFKEEVCKGFDAKRVAAKYIELGVFEADKQGKSSTTERLGGTVSRYHKINPSKLGELQVSLS